jgi:hypothetical protein
MNADAHDSSNQQSSPGTGGGFRIAAPSAEADRDSPSIACARAPQRDSLDSRCRVTGGHLASGVEHATRDFLPATW